MIIDEDTEKERIRKLNVAISERITFIKATAKDWLNSVTCVELEEYIGTSDEPF